MAALNPPILLVNPIRVPTPLVTPAQLPTATVFDLTRLLAPEHADHSIRDLMDRDGKCIDLKCACESLLSISDHTIKRAGFEPLPVYDRLAALLHGKRRRGK